MLERLSIMMEKLFSAPEGMNMSVASEGAKTRLRGTQFFDCEGVRTAIGPAEGYSWRVHSLASAHAACGH